MSQTICNWQFMYFILPQIAFFYIQKENSVSVNLTARMIEHEIKKLYSFNGFSGNSCKKK